jgi:hypothetical protein
LTKKPKQVLVKDWVSAAAGQEEGGVEVAVR